VTVCSVNLVSNDRPIPLLMVPIPLLMLAIPLLMVPIPSFFVPFLISVHQDLELRSLARVWCLVAFE
jgi:hypothetical protein